MPSDVGELLTGVGVILAVLVAWFESWRFRRTLTLGVHSQVFSSSFNALNVVLENPELRPYLYEGKQPPGEYDDVKLAQRVKVACEMFSDLFELVCLQMEGMRKVKTWKGWQNYMTDVIASSPALRNHFRESAEWVTAPVFQRIVQEGFSRAHEDAPPLGQRTDEAK